MLTLTGRFLGRVMLSTSCSLFAVTLPAAIILCNLLSYFSLVVIWHNALKLLIYAEVQYKYSCLSINESFFFSSHVGLLLLEGLPVSLMQAVALGV